MCLNTGFLVKLPTTDRTGYHNVGRIDNLMHVEAACLAEALAAVRTLVRLVFGVHKFVVAQVVLPAKRFTANITWKWPLVCVCALMDH